MAISPRPQSWLELRGIACSIDPEFTKLVPWMRTTFILCGSLIGAGTAFAYTPLLWVMVPIAASGAVFTVHPFDQIYNYGLRHLTGTRKLPPNVVATRFSCGVAAVWLVATALSFQLGVAPLGYALGASLTAVGVVVSTTHFCAASFVYQFLFGDRALALRTVFGSANEQVAWVSERRK